MHQALIWLVAIEAVGIVTLPLTYRLLGSLPDRGIIFSKAIGLLLAAYLFWALGLAGVLPNIQWAALLVVAALAVPSAMILWRNGPEILAFLKRERTAIIAAESVFLVFFLIWVALASFAPAINHTEQPMDFGFLNSILKSESFPPEDHWLSGHSISYYYFGHFMMAFLTKLTAIPSSVSYNLSIALIAALAAGGAFCLALNLVRIMGAGIKSAIPFALAAPVFILVLGNLEGVAELINAVGLGGGGNASLRTAVLREDLSEIGGLGAEDADPLSRDGVRQEQTWGGDGAGIERLAGKTVRLRFLLENTDLYAFRASG